MLDENILLNMPDEGDDATEEGLEGDVDETAENLDDAEEAAEGEEEESI